MLWRCWLEISPAKNPVHARRVSGGDLCVWGGERRKKLTQRDEACGKDKKRRKRVQAGRPLSLKNACDRGPNKIRLKPPNPKLSRIYPPQKDGPLSRSAKDTPEKEAEKRNRRQKKPWTCQPLTVSRALSFASRGVLFPIPTLRHTTYGYSTRTLPSDMRLPSTRCTAQAMQGSKEWMVRNTSSGFSGSAMGLPTRQRS